MITPDNNNKFYTMSYDGVSDTFEVERGRVEVTKIQEKPVPISKYDSVLKSKLKKGYKDVTHLVGVAVDKDVAFKKEKDSKVQQFVELMERYRNNLVSSTYTKASTVTKAQVDEAQATLDKLVEKKNSSTDVKNKLLVELYSIIPRKMNKVQNYLIPSIKLEDILAKEQDNLDAISSSVDTSVLTEHDNTLLTNIGLKMESVDHSTVNEIQYLMSQPTYYSNKPLKNADVDVYRIVNEREDKVYHKKKEALPVKDSKFLIHGTRNSSVLSIFEQGLKIRPAGNFHFAGKVYGNGNYYSETVAKSLNYTGNDVDKVLLVYEVLIGNPFVYSGWYRGNSFPLTEAELLKRGFHSTFVKAGNGLLNSEIIVYNEQQQRLAYLIHIKK
jgi:poly [ADP-ribose] polymerase